MAPGSSNLLLLEEKEDEDELILAVAVATTAMRRKDSTDGGCTVLFKTKRHRAYRHLILESVLDSEFLSLFPTDKRTVCTGAVPHQTCMCLQTEILHTGLLHRAKITFTHIHMHMHVDTQRQPSQFA